MDKVKYFAKLSAVGAITLVKFYLVASLSTALCAFLVVLFAAMDGHGAGPHTSGGASVIALFAARPLHGVLLLLVVASFWLLVVLVGKYTVKKVVHRIVSDKSEDTILPLMDKVIGKFNADRPRVLDRMADASKARLRLLQEVREGEGNRWVRRALAFAFKKARLDDVDFTQEDTRLSGVIKDKAVQALHGMSRPGNTAFRIVIGIQWLLVLAAFLMR